MDATLKEKILNAKQCRLWIDGLEDRFTVRISKTEAIKLFERMDLNGGKDKMIEFDKNHNFVFFDL